MKKKKSYTQKLFLSYSCAVLAILVLLFSLLGVILYSEQYKKNLETQMQLVVKTEQQIDASLKEMDRIINGLLFNPGFMSIVQDPQAQLHYTAYNNELMNTFMSLDAPLLSTYRIIAFTFSPNLYYNFSKTGESASVIQQTVSDYPYLEQVMACEGKKCILPVHSDPFSADGTPVYSVARSIVSNHRVYGIVEIQNTFEHLSDLCRLDSNLGNLLLFSSDGELVYPLSEDTTDNSLQELYQSIYQRAQNSPQNSGSFSTEGKQVSFTKSDYSGWTTLIYCPLTAVIPYASHIVAAMLFGFLLLCVVSIACIHLITRRMTAPLVELNQALSQVSLDNLSLSLAEDSSIVEIENINRSFQQMFQHLRCAIAKNVQARANEERANYLALQSQMNPHTIYNTIGMIESVSYMNGDEEVSNLCICFSQMLRYISDYTKREYTLGDELQHLSNYIVLIEKRYEGKLKITVNADPDLLRCPLPKFTIQPLVENSVKHGFLVDGTVLHVHVSASHIAQGWQLLVEDNGRGFSDEILEKIRCQLTQCDEVLHDSSGDVINRKIGNLALSNIYIRCRILWDERFSFTVSNSPGGGGRVELLFPAPSLHSEQNREES